MNRTTFLALCLGAAALGGCNAKPDMTIKEFMAKKVDPTSKVYFNAVRYIYNESGAHNFVPQTDADWEKVRKAAADLQDQAKALGDEYAEGRREDWTKMSADLATVSRQAEDAAKSKDPDKVFAAASDVYTVCSGCHIAYPAEGRAPGGKVS